MAKERAIIVYATDSKRIRRQVNSDDAIFDPRVHLKPGESWCPHPGDVLRDPEKMPDVRSMELVVESATGVKPPSCRHALVDEAGNVTAVVMMDPALDPLPEGIEPVQHDTANVGYRMEGGKFLARYALADPDTGVAAEIVWADHETGPDTKTGMLAIESHSIEVGEKVAKSRTEIDAAAFELKALDEGR